MYLFRFLIVLLCCVCKICALLSLFDERKGIIHINKGLLKIYCSDSQSRMTDVFKPADVLLFFKRINIMQCAVPNTTYIAEFNALNINANDIETLQLRFTQNKPLPPGHYTQGLKILNMSIESKNNYQLLESNQNFFDPLFDLQSLFVARMEIPPIPMTMHLINMTLSDGATIIDWGNCRYMQRLKLSNLNDEDFPIWPQNCTRLEHLEMVRMLPEAALKAAEIMIAAAPNLHTLKITDCQLYNLPVEMIQSAKNLVNLDLSFNKLYDEVLPAFPHLPKLKSLDLSRNLVRGYGLGSLIPKLPVLLKLVLHYEWEFNRVCSSGSQDLKNDFIVPLQNSSIESIDLKHTEFYLDCFKDIYFSNLKHISMSPSTVELKLTELPKTDADYLVMDFGNKEFLTIYFNEDDYKTLQKENSSSPHNRRNLTLLFSHVQCDCNLSWLARALRDFPHIISMPNLKCDHEDGMELLKLPKEQFECNSTGRDYCFYTQNWTDGTVDAECELKAWMKMEPLYPLHGLNVSGKGITTLHTKLPDTLQWLDLRHNHIVRATAEEAAALFAAVRRVWFAGNLLLCDCDNRGFIDAIQQHWEQVQDYELLKCVGTEQPLSSVSTDALCQVALITSLTVIGVLIVMAALIALLLHRYGQQLRVFLFSRGWCIRCLQQQDLEDKPYDAFISFAHEDREYVMETLLPGLENAPEQFRVCVHYRDWLVGEWIPAQIMRSVQLSKRTLILLSRNFVASAWSTLELRYSLANATEDANAKVLILIKDDVLETNLDMELRGYLTFNTYMRCDDPWFWEKLRYAMPHRLNKMPTRGDSDFDVGNDEMKMKAIDCVESNSTVDVGEYHCLQNTVNEITS